MINKDRLVRHFLEYVQIDSESRNELEMAKHLEKELLELGFEVSFDDVGDKIGGNIGNLIAKKKGDLEGSVFLSAHMDTVTPGNGVKPVFEGDVIKSDGTTILGGDDKGGIVSIMEAVRTIIDNKSSHPDIEIMFAVAEEVGLLGSRYVDAGIFKSKVGYVMDSGKPVGTIINSAPSETTMEVTLKGRPAHAGTEPENGISAIMIAARAIDRMNLLRLDEETTANVGIINGGVATNIVTPEVYLKAEARSLNDEKLDKQVAHMRACFEEAADFYGGQVDFKTTKNYKTYKVDESFESVNRALKAFESVGIEAALIPTGGGSDVNNLREKGIDCVNLAIAMSACHTLDEYIKVSDMVNVSHVLYEILTKW
ncbi:M20/M25/M40 family metallo-hydrolase [Acidaminobacter sp. JC074]|uniref:M20/M25/M40 family metallo-hydrolase n=1 Tax=Acidaminobacter sp. JC074 TaxID=2530199 RepID=UPI001F10BEE1|nr:M20/M25/M40 family metallo-hydrolase [Acidaminobacter sp. JC074]